MGQADHETAMALNGIITCVGYLYALSLDNQSLQNTLPFREWV
jgi:hypothetical protein